MPEDSTSPQKLSLWAEISPIAVHALVVLVIEASLLAIGLATKYLEHVLPEQKEHLEVAETIDAWTALALVAMFATYTVARVGIRLGYSLWKELKQVARLD